MNALTTSRIVGLLALAGICAADLRAECKAAPSVSVSPSLDANGINTLTVAYSFPDTIDGSQRNVSLAARHPESGRGFFLGQISPGSVSGTWIVRHGLSCEASGTYIYTAEAISCRNNDLKTTATAAQGFQADPTVGVSYLGPDDQGLGKVRVSYKFPYTEFPDQRRLEHTLVDPDGRGHYSGAYSAPDREGVWEFDFPMHCRPNATYVHEVPARRCATPAEVARDTTVLASKPTVSLSVAKPDAQGRIRLSATYGFPQTAHESQRTIGLYRVAPNGTRHWFGDFHPKEQYGTLELWTDAPCEKGPLTYLAEIRSCNGEEDESQQTLDLAADPKVSLTLTKGPLNENTGFKKILGTVHYDMGDGKQRWNVRVDLLKIVTADGRTFPGTLLREITPAGQTGTLVFEYDPDPTLGAQQVVFRATASTCTGRATEDGAMQCDCEGATGDPVHLTDGNVRVADSDPLPLVAGQRLVRTYNSDEQVVALFGRGWTTLFERRLVTDTDGVDQIVTVFLPANEVVVFRGTNGGAFRQTWPRSDRAVGTLTFDSASGTYTHRPAGSSELALFRGADGRLLALRDVSTAREARVTYDTDGLPQALTDSWSGLAWNLTIDRARRVVTSVSVGGRPDLVWSYGYDSAGNLVNVVAPGNATWRTYEYAANRMTTSRDAVGNLIESHTYDAGGYGISSTGPQDEIAAIAYNLPGSTPDERVTRLTYKTGATADYALRPSGGTYRPARVTGGCGACGTHDVTYARDARGRVVREQDARGYVTLNVYDPATHNLVRRSTFLEPAGCSPETDASRCRLTPEALAEAGLARSYSTVDTHFEYGDPRWPDRPTAIRTESLIAVASRRGANPDETALLDDGPGWRRETFAYDGTTGAVLEHAVSGWTVAGSVTRTRSTTLYTGVEGAAFHPEGAFRSEWLLLAQPAGLPKQVDGPRDDAADVSLFVYYPVHESVPAELRGRLAAVRNAAGHVVRYEAYDAFGNVTRSRDANGVVTESTHDALGRLTATALKGIDGCDTSVDPLCATDLATTRSYDGAGPLKTETRPGGGVTVYAYDARGRVESLSRGPAVADLRERIAYSYDPATGRKSLERMLARSDGQWVEKQRQSFTYDSDGLLQRITHADGTFVEYTYDAAHALATVRDENTTASPTVSIPSTRYTYTPAGQPRRVTQRLATAPEGVVETTYGYDARGNLTGVVDPNGNTTSYLYDDFDQLYRTISPVTGTTEFEYDVAGQLVATTDANGARTTRAYDALGRAVKATSTRGTSSETVSWTYDTGPFAAGRLSSMSDPAGTTSYAYERRGLLREETRTFSAAAWSYTTTFRYDRDGNRSSIAYPSTLLTVDYTYDYAGRPTTASGFVTAADYLPFGPLARLQFANGTTQVFGYDERYRMTENRLTLDAAPPSAGDLAKYTYAYDAVGNVTSLNDVQDNSYSRHFEYDELSRLVAANTRASGGSLWGKGSYAWDAMGNMLSYELGRAPDPGPEPLLSRARPKPPTTRLTIPQGRIGSFAYSGTTPLLESVTTNGVPRTVQYDAAGNETSFFATRTYSPRNLLQQVTDLAEGIDEPHRLTYSYDGRGLRVIRAESPSDGPGTTARRYFLYAPELRLLSVTRDDGPNVWLASSTVADKNVHYEIVWFGDRPVAQVTPGGSALYTFADHLGTPILQTDMAASVVWRAEYEPFGNVYAMRAGTRTDQPLRFPGQELAMTWEGPEENYNIFRWYRAGWGRYTQADPIGLKGGLNLFSHVFANPLRWTDPLGLRVRVCCKPIPATLIGKRHCYFEFDDGPYLTIGYHLHNQEQASAVIAAVACQGSASVVYDHGFDTNKSNLGECGPWNECNSQCVRDRAAQYGTRQYCLLGPNSNTFASFITKGCGLTAPPPNVVDDAPGWNDIPPWRPYP